MPSFLLPESLFRLVLIGSMVVATVMLVLVGVVFIGELRRGRLW